MVPPSKQFSPGENNNNFCAIGSPWRSCIGSFLPAKNRCAVPPSTINRHRLPPAESCTSATDLWHDERRVHGHFEQICHSGMSVWRNSIRCIISSSIFTRTLRSSTWDLMVTLPISLSNFSAGNVWSFRCVLLCKLVNRWHAHCTCATLVPCWQDLQFALDTAHFQRGTHHGASLLVDRRKRKYRTPGLATRRVGSQNFNL